MALRNDAMKGVADHPLRVNDESGAVHAFALHAIHFAGNQDIVGLAGDAFLVGQEPHGDAVFVAEGAVADAIVAGDAEHHATEAGKALLQVAELDRFGGAAGRIIAHVKKQHEGLAPVIRHLGDGHVRIRQFEVRCQFSNTRAFLQHRALLEIGRKDYMGKPLSPLAKPVGPFSMARFSLKCLLGGITPETFLAEYWQKKPLLVRQALPGFGDWLNRTSLSDLARRDDAESRLVRFIRGECLLDRGPFEAEDLAGLPKKNWSLLVSGVNHFLPEGDALLHAFDFIPLARLDDLMVSFAPPGGGVGPHFDSYDVFLIQGLGRRRWEISAQDDLEVMDGAPLRILKRFTPEQSWELEPGDLLYLPPQYAHNGVALSDCMTWSVGFRVPTAEDMVGNFLNYLQDNLKPTGLYSDPDLKRQRHPAEIPATMLDQVAAMLKAIRWDKDMVADFLGNYLSEPKSHIFFDPPERPLKAAAFAKTVAKRGVRLDPRSQLLFRGAIFHMNGERLAALPETHAALQSLADHRSLPPGPVDTALLPILHEWYVAGYLLPGMRG